MNCSRFVSLKYWTQLSSRSMYFSYSCELLSICIFEILNTAMFNNSNSSFLLWIALDLYLWNIEHSFLFLFSFVHLVVNCSRFVSLKYWTQPSDLTKGTSTGCELLSICIFEILNTASVKAYCLVRSLWIALDLYLWNIEHSLP